MATVAPIPSSFLTNKKASYLKYSDIAFSKSFFNSASFFSDENRMFPDAKTEETFSIPTFSKTARTSAIFIFVPFTFTPRRKAQYLAFFIFCFFFNQLKQVFISIKRPITFYTGQINIRKPCQR